MSKAQREKGRAEVYQDFLRYQRHRSHCKSCRALSPKVCARAKNMLMDLTVAHTILQYAGRAFGD